MDGFTAVIPIRPFGLMPSRLQNDDRQALARAFAHDVLDVAKSSELIDAIVVVSGEPEFVAAARRMGMVCLVDRPLLSADGLNDAIRSGRGWASVRRPESPIVVVPADLPAMTAQGLDGALKIARRHHLSFVPDASGVGTTLLAATKPADLCPAYGGSSAVRHSAGGSRPVFDVEVGVRHDVDTTVDLWEAHQLGAGEHSQTVIDGRLWRGMNSAAPTGKRTATVR